MNTDHRSLLSIVKEQRSNKSYNSSLTRWVDRLLSFDFKIELKTVNQSTLTA